MGQFLSYLHTLYISVGIKAFQYNHSVKLENNLKSKVKFFIYIYIHTALQYSCSNVKQGKGNTENHRIREWFGQ